MTLLPEDSLLLADIEGAAQTCLEFTNEASYEDFISERRTLAAVYWQLCVAGEAANRLSDFAKLQAPEVDWRRMIDTRNRLIHNYRHVDTEIVWGILQSYLRPLIAAIQRLQANLDTPPG